MRCVTYGELASFHAFEPFPATGSQMLLYGSQMPDENHLKRDMIFHIMAHIFRKDSFYVATQGEIREGYTISMMIERSQ